MNRKYYQIATQDAEASVFIYGDITSWEWLESDVSSYTLAKEIETLDVDKINVYINSYGGEVAEGWAIYNSLRRHKAKITTICDGFACSAASLIFMAGDERVMLNTSLLWIHNVQTYASGDHKELAKQAEDSKKMNELGMEIYLNYINITKEELTAMMDAETWLTPAEALEMGFATAISNGGVNKIPTQSVRKHLFDMILNSKGTEPDPEPEPTPVEPEQDPESDPKPVQNKPKQLLTALFGQRKDDPNE